MPALLCTPPGRTAPIRSGDACTGSNRQERAATEKTSRSPTCAPEDTCGPPLSATPYRGLHRQVRSCDSPASSTKLGLLVIDTLGVANGASEIDRAQVGAFFADWAAWADERDCAVLLIAHPPKTVGVTYSGSTGILGGVRAMWNIESVKSECRGDCDSPRNCKCEPAYAYRLVNAKQNYGESTGSVWLTNRPRRLAGECEGRKADYGENYSPAAQETDVEQTSAGVNFDRNTKC